MIHLSILNVHRSENSFHRAAASVFNMNLSNAPALLMDVLSDIAQFAALTGFQLVAGSMLLAGFLGFFIWRLLLNRGGNARRGNARGNARRGNARRGNYAVDLDVNAGLNLACRRRGSTPPPPSSISEVIEDNGGSDHVIPAGVSLYTRRFLSILQLVARNFFGYIEQFLMTPQATMDPQVRVDINIVQANLYHQRQLRIEAERYGPEMPPAPFTDSDEDET